MDEERKTVTDPDDPHAMDTSPGAGGAGLSGGKSTGADAGAGPGGPDGGWAAGGEEAEGRPARAVRTDEDELDADVEPGGFLTDPAEAGGDDQTPDGREGESPGRVGDGGADVDPAVRGRGMGDLTSRAPDDDEPHAGGTDRVAAFGPDLQPGAADEAS